MHKRVHSVVQYLTAKEVTNPSKPKKYPTDKERAIADYWLCTSYAENALIVVDIWDRRMLPSTGVPLRVREGTRATSGLFSQCSRWTFEKCRDSVDNFEDILNDWSARHNVIMPMDFGGHPEILTVVVMPAAHALLCCQTWGNWCFPYLTGTQRRGHSYELGRYLWAPGGNAVGDELQDESEIEQFGMHDFQRIADLLRCFQYRHDDSEVLRLNVHHQIRVLQHMRNNLLLTHARLTQRAFSMETIIYAVVLSGSTQIPKTELALKGSYL